MHIVLRDLDGIVRRRQTSIRPVGRCSPIEHPEPNRLLQPQRRRHLGRARCAIGPTLLGIEVETQRYQADPIRKALRRGPVRQALVGEEAAQVPLKVQISPLSKLARPDARQATALGDLLRGVETTSRGSRR
ncbi:hypothetical protein [Ilumatobacter sp.]|uniref:hypothetical protein n=1 Tax=Ilumatobacter sp. TaxID=1967498 RepID=UPI003AF9A001